MRVLVADGDEGSLRDIEASLRKWGYEVVPARSGSDAWRVLEGSNAPKIAILAWKMPSGDGIEICRRWRVKPGAPPTHILMLLEAGSGQDLLEGLNAGADDFLRRPLDPRELKARLRTGARIMDLERGLRESQDLLRVQSTQDPLTGAWNRPAILDFLGREFARASRERAFVAVLLADLDRFRKLNDQYGPGAGDDVLREAVGRMRASVRAYDAVGRYGGEEFLLVLPGTDGLTGLYIAERIREAVGNKPVQASGQPISVTVSLGVAAVGKDEDTDPLVLLRAADLALSRAKGAGRNRCALAAEGDLTIEASPHEE
jgi:two-component system cell cycle response regulator